MTLGGNSIEQLKSIISRAVNLEDQKAEIGQDIKDLYAEAKSNGFDPAAIKELVKEEREKPEKKEKRLSKEEMLAVYKAALGQLSDLPLGRSAIERAS